MYKILITAIGLIIWTSEATIAFGEVIVKQYETGGIYEGEFLNGKQHGQGKYRLPNGYTYEGSWIDGRIEGEGKAEYPDGAIYEGNFKSGQPSGSGSMVFPDGST